MSEDQSVEDNNLTRRERRRLLRGEKKEEQKKEKNNNKLKSWVIGFVIIAAIFTVGFLIFKNANKPVPGEEAEDLGREHVTDIAGIEYSSNPPSSGSHFAVWAKQGIYDRLISDGYLIHSLEHGYINISYDCTKSISSENRLVKVAKAHEEPAKESTDSGELLKHLKYKPKAGEGWFTPENPPEVEIELPDAFKSDSCNDLVTKLSEFAKVAERVIIVPRVEMETPIALTAWGKILKLQNVDEEKIKTFIRAYHNKGPEKTME